MLCAAVYQGGGWLSNGSPSVRRKASGVKSRQRWRQRGGRLGAKRIGPTPGRDRDRRLTAKSTGQGAKGMETRSKEQGARDSWQAAERQGLRVERKAQQRGQGGDGCWVRTGQTSAIPGNQPTPCPRSFSKIQCICSMDLERAVESLKAAELCLREGLVNSAANRAYYAMFQAAQSALEAQGIVRSEWSHKSLHPSFNQQLIHQRKVYPRVFRDYLTSALVVRQAADYGEGGISGKIAQRQVRRASVFVKATQEVIAGGKSSQE